MKRRLVLLEKKDKVYLKLVKGIEDGYKILYNVIKLSFIKEGPFLIIEKVDDLIYKLKLPD